MAPICQNNNPLSETPMTPTTLELELHGPVAIIWMNRPELRNALNPTVIAELTETFLAAGEDAEVRAVVLAGRGKAFCAGADLNWMKETQHLSREDIMADSLRLADLLQVIHTCPKPVIARLHGPTFAGGMGLAAACDIAFASTEASFCLSEVRLGLLPAMISPYVLKAMGEQSARRFMLTGEVFDAAEAYRIGFVHDIAPADELDGEINVMLGHLLAASPHALTETKRLIRDVGGRSIDGALIQDTAQRIADARASADGQEGMAAFLDKRKAAWVPQDDRPL